MSEEILKVLEKLKNKSNYQRDCNDESYFIELFANEIYILCKFMEDLQQKVEQLENIRKEAIGYVTSYESISTIQGLDDIEKNKNLDEKTMNEMINRYLKVHDILLNILNKGSE